MNTAEYYEEQAIADLELAGTPQYSDSARMVFLARAQFNATLALAAATERLSRVTERAQSNAFGNAR